MANLIGARQSPRICAGDIHWYYGDTFSITFELRLRDQDGEIVNLEIPIEGPEDDVSLEILDRSEQRVDLGDRVTSDIYEGTVTLEVDSDLSRRMAPGQYRLTISVVHAGLQTTILHRCRIVVE